MAPRRRVRNRGSVEALPSGAYRARIRGAALDGRTYDLKTTCGTMDEAERALAGLRKRAFDIESGLVAIEETLTLAEWTKKARRRGVKWRAQDASMWKLMRPLWNVRLVELDALRLMSWSNKLLESYAGNTVKGCEVLLKRLVHAAVKARIIARPPWGAGKLTLVREADRAEGRAVEPEEWHRLREAARALDAEGATRGLWLRLCVQVYTGLRPVELCRLQPGMLSDHVNGPAFDVPRAIVAKGGRAGLKPIPPSLAADVRAHAETCRGVASTGLLFPFRTQRGRWRSREQCHQGRDWLTQPEVKKLRTRALVADFRPYMLRHFRLTEAAHVSPQLAQNLGGHRHHKTTQRYIHSGGRHLDAALWDDGLLHAPADPSPEGPDDGGKPAGRFRVIEGGASDAPSTSSAPTHAPSGEINGGLTMGGDRLTRDDVEPLLGALALHGADAVAQAFVKANEPAYVDEECRLLAGWAVSRDATSEDARLVVQYIGRIRAHGHTDSGLRAHALLPTMQTGAPKVDLGP